MAGLRPGLQKGATMRYFRKTLDNTPGYSDYLFVCEDGRIFRARCNGPNAFNSKEMSWSFFYLNVIPKSKDDVRTLSVHLYNKNIHGYEWDGYKEFVTWLKEQKP